MKFLAIILVDAFEFTFRNVELSNSLNSLLKKKNCSNYPKS